VHALTAVPTVDLSALFQPKSAQRDATETALLQAAGDIGFLRIIAPPAEVPIDVQHAPSCCAYFSWRNPCCVGCRRRKFAPENPNVYRGWFPVQPDNTTSKDGIDIGADIAYEAAVTESTDPLREPTLQPRRARYLEDPGVWVSHDGARHYVVGAPHAD
jgi:isopenicillin N synthase-like dioxygenase